MRKIYKIRLTSDEVNIVIGSLTARGHQKLANKIIKQSI